MQKHDINSPALRDPKREWYDAEEVEEAMEALKKANEWRTDWENVPIHESVLVTYPKDSPLEGTFFIQFIKSEAERQWRCSNGYRFKTLEP